jgi:hypothetical protein
MLAITTSFLFHFYKINTKRMSWDSSAVIVLGYGLDDRGFESRQGLGILLLTTASRLALGPTQPPIQRVPGALSLGVKRPGSEADHSPPSSAEVKNVWSYTSTPPGCFHGVVLSYNKRTEATNNTKTVFLRDLPAKDSFLSKVQ